MKLYEILNVPKNVDQKTLKKQYTKLVIKNHPDKGGTAEKFEQIKQAYDILSKPEYRKIYDETGIDREEEIERFINKKVRYSKTFNKDEVFRRMFGSAFNSFRKNMNQNSMPSTESRIKEHMIFDKLEKPNPVTQPIDIYLKDCFLGRTINVSVKCHIFCDKCNGERFTKKITCPVCANNNQRCKHCLGKGMIYDIESKCDKCRNTGLISAKKQHEINIYPGVKNGETIIIEGGKGNMIGYTQMVDIHLVIKIRNNQNYKRVGNDLHMKYKIPLKEALVGFRKEMIHLSGKKYILESNKIISHNQKQKIKNLGFPFREPNGELSYGNLVITYDLKMPTKITDDFKRLCNIHL